MKNQNNLNLLFIFLVFLCNNQFWIKKKSQLDNKRLIKILIIIGSFYGPLLFSFLFKIHLLIGGILNGKNVHEHNDDDVYGKNDVRNELHEHDDGSNARNGHGNEYGSNDV